MTKRRYIFIAFAFFAVFTAAIACAPGKTLAANISIVGGTNGPDCSSGGYFTPSTVTVNSGDTATISVPAGDPYAGGMEVHFSNGLDYTIARGGSQTTAPLAASVTYYGTWPSSGCLKGSGAITVNAPAPPPSPPPASAPPPPPASSGGGSGSSLGSGKPSVSPTPSSATAPQPVQQSSGTVSSQPPAGTATAPQSQSSRAVATDTAKMPAARNVRVMRIVGISAGAIVTVVVAGAVVWIFVVRRG